MIPDTFQLHLIEPRDPLIARDGRPFMPDPGARATSLPFPFPSTLTGGIRTRAGQDAAGLFNRQLVATVKEIAVRGPLLAELDAQGDLKRILAPAPLDCVFLQGDEAKNTAPRLKQLVPARLPADVNRWGGVYLPLPEGCETVTAFSERETEDSKPDSGPAFWFWEQFEHWLQHPQPQTPFDDQARRALGLSGPTRESRTHVALKESSYASEEGKLFGTRGLEFRVAAERGFHRLALAAWSDENHVGRTVAEGAGHLGGERRLMVWRTSRTPAPRCPCAKVIAEKGACRVILLSPAHFEAGWRPRWLLESGREWGVSIELVAACVGRPAVVSGWDFENRSPKPTRRLAPSGSTYFLRLTGGAKAIEEWAENLWLCPVSDDAQSRHDGFGLAALGVSENRLQEGLL